MNNITSGGRHHRTAIYSDRRALQLRPSLVCQVECGKTGVLIDSCPRGQHVLRLKVS